MTPLTFLASECKEETSPVILQGIIKRIINAKTGSKTLSAMSIRLDVGGSVRRHNHVAEEIYLVASGSGEVLIDKQALPISKDTFVFIPSNAEHEIRNLGNEPLNFFAFMAPIA